MHIFIGKLRFLAREASGLLSTRFPLLLNSRSMVGAQFIRFLAVGVVATAVHFSILVLLVRGAGADPIMSSMLGFVAAAITNYLLNYHVTFESRRPHSVAFIRFVIVASLGLLINSTTMWILIHGFGTPYLLAQIGATTLVLFWNFFCNRAWTFE